MSLDLPRTVESSAFRPSPPAWATPAYRDPFTSYKTVSWQRASIVLMKAQIGLGVLGMSLFGHRRRKRQRRTCPALLSGMLTCPLLRTGIPSVFQILGLIPGIILLLVVYAMASFSSWAIPSFVKRHPEVRLTLSSGAELS